jgi:GNAT superfamily N-acetyltransferase
VIRPAVRSDLDDVRAVARAAGALFRSIDEPSIAARADDAPMPVGELEAACVQQRLWVAVDDGAVVGFVVAEVVDGCAHVEEVSVHPDAQGRGHGGALLDAVDDWATDHGLAAVTLTTYRDVPWNRPFYERRGFRVLRNDELTDGLRRIVRYEAALGLDPDLRVVMRRGRRGA